MSKSVSGMPGPLKIDRAIYLVGDETKTYRFLRRNPEWAGLDPAENETNKRQIDGYTRIFKDGRKKTFRFRPRLRTMVQAKDDNQRKAR